MRIHLVLCCHTFVTGSARSCWDVPESVHSRPDAYCFTVTGAALVAASPPFVPQQHIRLAPIEHVKSPPLAHRARGWNDYVLRASPICARCTGWARLVTAMAGDSADAGGSAGTAALSPDS